MITFPEPQKIAVLRANALGDYIFILPALQALRERFPNTEIVLLGRAWHKVYLDKRPGPVDRVIVVPRYQGISEAEGFIPDPQELDRFFNDMQKERFDIAFQLHGGGRNSNPFLLRLGAKLTIGLRTPDAPKLDINVPYVYYFSEILRYLEVVARAGAKTSNIEPQIAVTEKDIHEAEEVIGAGENPVAVIHPGASDPRRHWPAQNFAVVADRLIQDGYRVCITGMPFEKKVVDKLISSSRYHNRLLNLSGKLTLGGMTGLLAKASLLVANDTGPLHLARALKTPTVGIYWCGNGITGLPMTTAQNRPLLSFKIECPICGLSAKKFGTPADPETCNHEASFVEDIGIEEVLGAVNELVDLEASEKGAENRTGQSEAA